MKYYDSQIIDRFTDLRTRDYFHMLTSLNLTAKDPRVVLPAGQISRTCKCMLANAGSSCPANAAASGCLHCLYLHRLQTFNFFEYQQIVVKEQKEICYSEGAKTSNSLYLLFHSQTSATIFAFLAHEVQHQNPFVVTNIWYFCIHKFSTLHHTAPVFVPE